jgi:peroxiredoxin
MEQPMGLALRRGAVVPSFTLPDSAGRMVRRTQYRGRRHLILAFLPTGEAATQAYLQALAGAYPAIQETGGEALAILRLDSQAAHERLELPFPLLGDAQGAVTARFLPPEAGRTGVFVTDRYGELYYSATTAQAPELPPPGELVAWLEAIDRQCAI